MIFNPNGAMRENVYINDGNEFWELLSLIEMRPNQLVIFDGRMPYSQHIQPESVSRLLPDQPDFVFQRPRLTLEQARGQAAYYGSFPPCSARFSLPTSW